MKWERHHKGMLLLVLVGLLLMIAPIMVVTESLFLSVETPYKSFDEAYQAHAPISITSNADFASQATLEEWEGTGTALDPYIIGGYTITTTYSCIVISGVTVYFIIRDCSVETLQGGVNYGIRIESSSHGRVEDCIITNAGTGVFVKDSSDVRIENSEIYHHMKYAINLESSSYCDVTGNEIYDNPKGIFAQFSENSLVRGNSLYNNSLASINLYDAEKIAVLNNTAELSDTCFLIESSQNCTISRNIAFDSRIDGYLLTQSTFCALADNVIYDSVTGVHLENANYCELRDNKAQNNTEHGFILSGSDEIVVENNYAFGNEFGYELKNCWNGTLLDNAAINNTQSGFVFDNVENPVVSDNLACHNVDGFLFSDADYCTITGNVARDNERNGYAFGGTEHSSENIVKKNVAIHNAGYGFSFTNLSSRNIVYRNVIGWNELRNALDNGDANVFDDSISKGNAWDDYEGVGNYLVPGDAESVDHYPTTADLAAPEIDPLDDIEIASDTSNQWVNWSVSSGMPKSYEILRNGSLVCSGEWDENWIAYNLDNLQEGTYNFTLIVVDLLDNEAVDTVIVKILPENNDPQMILAIGGGAAVVVVIAVVIIRRREEQ